MLTSVVSVKKVERGCLGNKGSGPASQRKGWTASGIEAGSLAVGSFVNRQCRISVWSYVDGRCGSTGVCVLFLGAVVAGEGREEQGVWSMMNQGDVQYSAAQRSAR